METTGSMHEILDAPPLTDAELDEVNGGLFFLVAGLLGGFGVGLIGGAIAANYVYTGNFWGDVE